MASAQLFVHGLEVDSRTAALLTGAACVMGALVVLVRRVNSHQEAEKKIQKARNRRAESLQRAEQAVLEYRELVRAVRESLKTPYYLFRCKV